MRTLELADDIDEDFIRDVHMRISEVKAQKKTLVAQLEAAQAAVANQQNPNLLDALPQGHIDVSALPMDLQRRLYDAFRLEIVCDHARQSLRAAVTIFGEAVGPLADLVTEAMQSSGQKENWCEVEDSTAPVWSVPPAGDAPGWCRADLRKHEGFILIFTIYPLRRR